MRCGCSHAWAHTPPLHPLLCTTAAALCLHTRNTQRAASLYMAACFLLGDRETRESETLTLPHPLLALFIGFCMLTRVMTKGTTNTHEACACLLFFFFYPQQCTISFLFNSFLFTYSCLVS